MEFIKISENEAIEILKHYGLITENIRGTIKNVKDTKPTCFTNEKKTGVFVEYEKIEDGNKFYRVFLYSDDREFLKGVTEKYKNDVVSLLKSTSVVGYITVQDLTRVSDIIRSRTYEAFFTLIITAIIYFILSWIIAVVVEKIADRIFYARKHYQELLPRKHQLYLWS